LVIAHNSGNGGKDFHPIIGGQMKAAAGFGLRRVS
jgi:hypothetical protein